MSIQWTPKGLDFDGKNDWIELPGSWHIKVTYKRNPRWPVYLSAWARLWCRVAWAWLKGTEG